MSIFGSESAYLNLTTVLVAVGTLVLYALYKSTTKPANFPPGPFPLPLIGNVTSFMSKKSVAEVFTDLRQKYGDVFSLKLAGQNMIILNGIDVVKEALIKKGADFAGRPKLYSMELATQGYKDVVFSDYGVQWRYQRKLCHTAIRHFAQPERLEKLVFSVTPGIAKVLDELGDKPFAPKFTIGMIIYNILATMCFGKQYELDDPEITMFIKVNKELNELFGNGLLVDYIPIIRYLPTLPTEKKIITKMESMFKMFYDEIDAHRKKFDPENVSDFIDSLLLTQKEAMESGEEEAKNLTNEHIGQTVMDIFGAGTETTILTIHWSVGIMAENPEIQERVAKEINDVIGPDTLPSLDHRGLLPFTEAALLETLRYGTVAPTGVPHATLADTTLAGYDIPKGTTVMINHMDLHFDPKVWDEPNKFKPERFLNENGQLLSKMPESLLPFSAGRRVCLGEDFARKEVFLLYTWLFSRYRFYKVPGKESESCLKLNQISGFLHQPIDEMEVCVQKR